MTLTPLTNALIAAEYPADEAWLCLARRLERRNAAWARSARKWRSTARYQGRHITSIQDELAAANAEADQRIVSLICERDRLQYRAQERRALRTEIEAALGMESLPEDVEDSSLKRGLAVIQAMKADIDRLTDQRDKALAGVARAHDERSEERILLEENLARMTAEREEAQADRDKLAAKLANLAKERSDVTDEYLALQADLARMTAEREEAQADRDKLAAKLANLAKERSDVTDEYLALRARAKSPTPDHIADASQMVQPADKHVPETDFGNPPQAAPAPHPDSVEVRNRIGGINVEEAGNRGDNLAIVLASYFSEHEERPDDDRDDPETGWSVWAMQKTNTALTLIAVAAVGGAK